MSPALIALLPFLGAMLAALTARSGRTLPAVMAGGATLAALVGLLTHAPAILAGQAPSARWDWVPALGLSASFRIDGLALMFAGLILGIGLLIILYARFYLAPRDDMGRFMTFLMLFQGAMTGIVLSDNILFLLVFWELTSLTSFLLIGWWRDTAEGRQGARMALAVTGGGGLALIGGMLLLGQAAGSYEISQIITRAAQVQENPLYLPALILILLGCFTKSAQFPFHFWLPHAMAAPTPVSAYLHSATMVKAGLFLMARLWPALSGTPEWTGIVATAGLLTMLLGAVIAFFKDDLKAILAFSTVSHLGLITFLLGLGTEEAAAAAIFHILAHAGFKAALFMVAGIVDHATHTRDIRSLGGLRRAMPVTFALALVASLSMAGIPPLNGFLSKEMLLAEAARTSLPVALLVLSGTLVSVAYSLRFLTGTFLGQPRSTHHAHDPGPGLWAAPALLVAIVIASGLMPMTVFGPLVTVATAAVTGAAVTIKISHWHGLAAPALWMSIAAVGGGVALLSLYPRLRGLWDATPRPQAKATFDAGVEALAALARRLTEGLHDGSLSRALWVTVVTILAAAAYAFQGAPFGGATRIPLPLEGVPLVAWAATLAVTLAVVWVHADRLLALILTGVVGLLLSAAFAWFSAPDLALTQLTVEVVTVLLMLLALNFLPKTTPLELTPLRRLRDGTLAALAAAGAGGLAYALMLRDPAFPVISGFQWAQSKPGAGGTNAVNTIIVDFRGYDTFGEIIVLGIAALVIFAVAETVLASRTARARLAALDTGGNAGDPHPVMLVVGTRFLLPVAMLVGVYIYLRGHNLPGGGFVAGLIFSIAFLLQYVASGYVWSDRRLRLDPHVIIGAGVAIATLTGAGAWAFGLPFLTSGFDYVALPGFAKVELATAALFDLGVFLCVLGAVILSLATLSRLAQVTPDGKLR